MVDYVCFINFIGVNISCAGVNYNQRQGKIRFGFWILN